MITTRVNTSPAHFTKLVGEAGFTSADAIAKHFEVHHTTVYRWMDGVQRIPVAVIRYLELKAEKQ